MRKNCFYITKNYQSQRSAAGKAKIDCEDILNQIGFKNIGLPRTSIPNSIIGFFLTFVGTIIGLIRLKRNSTICIQYPLKKYYKLIIKVALLKQCKIITIIHDLRSHRKGKISISDEIKLFNNNHTIISHNQKMTLWLTNNELKSNVIDLEIFDYLGYSDNKTIKTPENNKFKITYAGFLAERKNGFLYNLAEIKPSNYNINLYGVGFDESKLKQDNNITYNGSLPANEIINKLNGHFGLVWDGSSYTECSGNYGKYLKINNPHKTSLYLRAGLPVIIWDKAALANFITKNNIGLTISSLAELDEMVKKITPKQFELMQLNAIKIGKKIGTGHYLEKAINKCINTSFSE